MQQIQHKESKWRPKTYTRTRTFRSSVVRKNKERTLFFIPLEKFLSPLYEKYIGFGNARSKSMLTHFHMTLTIKISNQEQEAVKLTGYSRSWDTATHISTFQRLGDIFVSTDKPGYHYIHSRKMLISVAHIQLTEYFPFKMNMDWENKYRWTKHMHDQRLTSSTPTKSREHSSGSPIGHPSSRNTQEKLMNSKIKTIKTRTMKAKSPITWLEC